eukprot:8199105-Heterocapsa_arctica.AAC.1
MGIDKQSFCGSRLVSSSDFVQNDKGATRKLMVIARMPEDRSNNIQNLKTFKNLQSHIHLCVYTCRAH